MIRVNQPCPSAHAPSATQDLGLLIGSVPLFSLVRGLGAYPGWWLVTDPHQSSTQPFPIQAFENG